MIDAGIARLEDLVSNNRFDQSALEINDRFRELSAPVLDAFSDILTTLVMPTFRGDLANLGSAVRLCGPSARSRLRSFVQDQRAQNCLTAVLLSLEKQVPSSVLVGFRSAADFFRSSEFHNTYRADIVTYEPEFSRLSDKRLARLLTHDPEGLDWTLFDQPPLDKKQEILAAFEQESLKPIRKMFGETMTKTDAFFKILAEHSRRFRAFYEDFRSRGFRVDDGVMAEWSVLGDEYFHIELSKSSLMLPISPKAVYWGMHEEYPETLARLRELQNLVTPKFAFTGPEKKGDGWEVGILCTNPESLRGKGFELEPALRFDSESLPRESLFHSLITTSEANRSYGLRLTLPPGWGRTLRFSIRITCEGKYYTHPFRTEKLFEIAGP